MAWDEVRNADELILTSTTHPVVPVGLLDDVTFDAPGPVTSELAQIVDEMFQGRHQLSGQWLTPLAAGEPGQAGAAT